MTLQGKGIADSAVRASDMHSALQELETREKGVDLCILMDGTGSMVSSSYNTNVVPLYLRTCTNCTNWQSPDETEQMSCELTTH